MNTYYYFMGTAHNVSKKTGNPWWAVKVLWYNPGFQQMEIKLLYITEELYKEINTRGYDFGLALDLFMTPSGVENVSPSKTFRPLALGAKN